MQTVTHKSRSFRALSKALHSWPSAALRCPGRFPPRVLTQPAQARRLSCRSSIQWLAGVQYNSETGNGNPLQQPFDAIFVLAGGLQPDGSCPEWVTRRCDVAYGLQQQQQKQRPPIVLLGGGTPHKPSVITPSGHVLHESTSCAQYLISKGASPSDLLKETSSFDTVGNAYFGLTIHALPAGWRRAAVVTSDFHMPRSMHLFNDIWALAGQEFHGSADWFDLAYFSASDAGIFTNHVYQARIDKEAESRAMWAAVSPQLHSLRDFHTWFFQTHLCYAVPRQHEFGKRTIKDEALLNSY